MSVSKRHSEILHLLLKSDQPLSGAKLAGIFNVSRQIIVQDMNSLKEEGYQIIATSKGYIMSPEHEYTRIMKVKHSVEETRTELNLIVDLGATVKDVFIFHKMYGEIHGPLNISSRRDVDEFCEAIKTGKSAPLSTATSGYHYHTISARDEETLTLVEEKLWEAGFLTQLTDYEPTKLIEEIEYKKEN